MALIEESYFNSVWKVHPWDGTIRGSRQRREENIGQTIEFTEEHTLDIEEIRLPWL